MNRPRYVGRFAPSPSGPLHAGSLVAAMASYLDARAHGGQWLLRIEDVDEARAVPGAAEEIRDCLLAFGMRWDGDVVWQSRRKKRYAAAFARLESHTFPCGCTRREIADSRLSTGLPLSAGGDSGLLYPGNCRNGLAEGKSARAFRLRVPDPGQPDELVCFDDRWQGRICQHLASESGDFILKRADGFWAYQLAVVVDDAAQQVSDVVRGADLIDSTARQIHLQRLLGLPTPRYLHVPVVCNAEGEKLSKQTGARALDMSRPLPALRQAASTLRLEIDAATVPSFWEKATAAWGARFV
ncbi:MAG: tRNA glutamyl-Q(34) synthetase GluQRS [Herminiimonas sp.]|nr:tRNA glutamyl-Q(34) synthetase GluQRS [Herminiimonas sp.]